MNKSITTITCYSFLYISTIAISNIAKLSNKEHGILLFTAFNLQFMYLLSE